jgi:hypothetical protein
LGQNVASKLFNSTNVTGGYYAMPLYGSGPQYYNVPKFYEHFVKQNLNANSGDPYNTIPLFTAEEALLNRAEAYVRLGNTAAAVNDLNNFASKNIDNYNATTHAITTQKAAAYYNTAAGPALINAALDFKRAFFIHEGLRWLDILRLKIPVVHTTTQGERFELGPDDKRRILQLPVLTKQAGLEPNAR